MAESLLEALAEFQQELMVVGKDAVNPFFSSGYVSLPTLMKRVMPVLQKHDLYITQFPAETSTGEPGLSTTLFHVKSQQTIEVTSPLSLVKKDPQAQGSAITYMRRYALAAILQIVIDEDDDGNKATFDQPTSDAISGKAVNIVVSEIKKSLSAPQQSELRSWMQSKGLSLVDPVNVVDKDLAEIYRKISELKEAI